MLLHIKLFAGLADVFGSGELVFETDETQLTIARLKELLMQQYPHLSNHLQSAFFAKNHTYAAMNEPVCEEDELALIPPVSGGSEPAVPEEAKPVKYWLTFKRLDSEEAMQRAAHPNRGATLLFVGTTREFTYGKRTLLLQYEAYEPMALAMMKQIGAEIAARWPDTECAIVHRLGQVEIGEASVIIAVSSPHRAACYEASRYAIERLKQIVPIWKKEIWEDGSEWKGAQQHSWSPLVPLRTEKEEENRS